MPSPTRTLALPLCLSLATFVSLASSSNTYANDTAGSAPAPTAPVAPVPRHLDEYGQIPLFFEPNQGQADSNVRFLSHSGGQVLLLEQNAAVLLLREASSTQKDRKGNAAVSRLKIQFAGARSEAQLEPLDEQSAKSNYFLGSRPENWHTQVPNYLRVEYRSLYTGIDLVFYGNGSHLEHDFVVAPGADYRRIALDIQGGRSVRLADDGSAVIRTAGGAVHFSAPKIYQVRDGRKVEVAGGFRLARHQLKFRVGAYDQSLPLIIDPVLSYSTYLAGSQGELPFALAVDSNGNAFITGLTFSTDFPTKNPFQSACSCSNGPDVFISKLNSTGTGLIYSTYLGGSNYDQPASIAIDGAGNAIVAGSTSSTDFPTKNPLTIHSNFNDTEGFITSLSPDGASLNFSTYLGGSGGAGVSTVTTDGSGNIYAAGLTDAADFPITPATNVIGLPPAYPLSDIFVAKLTSAGGLVFASVIGPDPQQQSFNTIFGVANSNGIAVDSDQNIYLAGRASPGFPVTAGAFQTTYTGPDPFCGTCTMGFVAKLKPDGSAFTYATYLGGTGGDQVVGLALDSSGNAFVTGNTSSVDFPTTSGALQTTFPADPFGPQCCQTFVTKLDPTGSKLVYSTFMGAPATFNAGTIGSVATGIAIDGSGDAFLTGFTAIAAFPLKNPVQTTLPISPFGFGNDPATYVTKLNAAGSAILFSTLFSGPNSAEAVAVAVDHIANANAIYITGTAFNDGLPTTTGAFQTTVAPPPPFTETSHAFVTKFDLGTAAPTLCPDQNSLFLFANINTDSFPTTLNLTNCGNAQLTISHIAVDGIFKETDTCQAPIDPGQKCVITLTFHPTSRGNFSGSLTISDNAPIQPTKFPIQATAVGPIVQLGTNQMVLDEQLVGQSGAATPLFVFNQGDGLLTISSVTKTGTDFTVNSLECTTAPVQPGSACLIWVTFQPLAAGLRTGSLLIKDDAPDSPQMVTLQGTGITSYPVPSLTEAGPSLILEKVDQQTITVSGSNFFPVSRIRINGIQVATNYQSPSFLSATVPLNLVQNLGTLKVDVLTPGPGGGISNSADVLIYQNIPLSANDIVFEPYSRQIYASISSGAASNPNTIVAVDPEKQTVGEFVPIGNNPDHLALSEDGKFLYAGLDGDHAVQQFDILAGKLGFLTPLPNDPFFGNFLIAGEIHTVPGRSQDYVVSLSLQGSPPQAGVSLVTNGVQRTAFSAETTQATAVTSICFLSDPSTFYGYNGTQIVAFKIQNNTSLQFTTSAPPAQPLNLRFACDSKYLYDYSGSVFDPINNQSIGSYQLPGFNFGEFVIPETPLDRTYFLTGPVNGLTAFDQKTFAPVGTISFPNSIFPFKLLRWGSDGFALLNFNFTGAGGDLVLIRSGLAQPSAGPNPIPRLKSVEPQVRQNNGNFQLTVEGKDFVPGAVVRWNNSDRSTIFVSDKVLIADIPNADLSHVGVATITVLNPPKAGGLSNAISYPIREPILVSVAVTPDNPSIVKGKTQKFKATGTYSDGATKDLTASVTWSSKTKKVATISAAGVASGIDTGTSLIEANSGKISASTLLTVYVGNFTEKLSKQSLTVVTGKTVSVVVTIAPVSKFSADVKLSAAGLPEGASASFVPEIVKRGSGTATLTISTTKATALGLFSVTVTGAAGSLQHTSQLVLGVNSSPENFSVSASPDPITFFAGTDGTATTITITPNGGFTGDVKLTISGLPAGVEASFYSSDTVTGGSGSDPLFMIVDPATTAGSYSLQITATSGAIVNTKTIGLAIVPLPTN
jgi:hypothetical protein